MPKTAAELDHEIAETQRRKFITTLRKAMRIERSAGKLENDLVETICNRVARELGLTYGAQGGNGESVEVWNHAGGSSHAVCRVMLATGRVG